jgi:hypothetical protein
MTYIDAFTITPHDTTVLTRLCHGFSVGVAGNVVVLTALGNVATIPVVAGVIYPLLIKRVNSTSTTATGIVGWTRG